MRRRVPWWRSNKFWDRVTRTAVFLALLAGSITYLIPLAWMLSTALKSDAQVYQVPSGWIPKPIVWQNFEMVFTRFPFWLFLRNSLITSVIPVIGVLLSSTVVAYAFARLDWPGRNLLFMILLGTMMLPEQVTFIPVYILWSRLKAINTFWPLVVPSFFGGAWNIFFIRQFFRTIPQELSDAAIMDGCSHMGILWRIMVPLSKPALATIAVFTFMGHWNDLWGPVIYLNDKKMYTLQIGLAFFRSEYKVDWQPLMACSLLVLLPSIVIFFIGQKYFVQGIQLTGISGR